MAKRPLTEIRLTIRCNQCGSDNIKVGPLGYPCANCGSYDLSFGSDERTKEVK